MAGLEPVFTPGRPVWPLAGPVQSSLEPQDPDLAVPSGSLEVGRLQAHHRHVIRDQSLRVAETPAEALVPPVATRVVGAKRKLSAAVVASLVFHAAIAMVFVDWALDNDPTLIEGTDFSGVAMLGSAADQVAAGEQIEETILDTTTITMVTMLEAQPVEMLEAAVVPVETVETVDTKPAEVAAIERIEPVRETSAARPVMTEQPIIAAVETAQPVKPEAKAVPVAAAALAPEVLATDRPESVDDTNTVQKTVDALQAEPVEPVEARPVQPVETTIADNVKPLDIEPLESETVARAEPERTVRPVTEVLQKLAEEVVNPEPKPVEVAKSKPVKTPQKKPVKKTVVEKKQAKAQEKPVETPSEKPAKRAKKAGSGGRNEISARRGQADGKATGDSAQASRGGSRTGGVGNAAESNYKGRVQAKLMRAARSMNQRRAGRDVTVSFTVTANGSVRGVRASGSAAQQAQAITVVNRAAPFPPIPAGAGRSSWDFTFPLGFGR